MNYRRLFKLPFGICCALFISSCGVNSKKSYLESFENFIVEIEETKSISSEEMTSIKKDYLDYTETYYHKYENELSSADEELIVELKARYYTAMAKQGLKDVGSAIKDLGEQASEFINDMRISSWL